MRHFFCMEKAEGLPFIRWIPEMSILISLWEWNRKESGYTMRKDYRMVYAAPWMPTITLDNIFERFNIDRSEDFRGHSLSVVM